jgi:hypothetical protein
LTDFIFDLQSQQSDVSKVKYINYYKTILNYDKLAWPITIIIVVIQLLITVKIFREIDKKLRSVETVLLIISSGLMFDAIFHAHQLISVDFDNA